MKNTIVGVDLALKVIQVCVYTNKKVQSNTEMTPEQFSVYLSTLTPSTMKARLYVAPPFPKKRLMNF